MTFLKAIPTTVFCAALIGATFAPSARADDWNRKTVVTFSAPVEIPGVHLAGWGVLPAGTYVFKILDSLSDRHIVQIFSQDELTVYATILAIPNYRLKATDKTVITFRERPAGRAGSAAGLVLSRQKLGRGVRLSESQSNRTGHDHQYCPFSSRRRRYPLKSPSPSRQPTRP